VKRASPTSDRGSIVLVALCLVAVLGITIGSYLALSSQAMRLSNRTFQTTLSEHLAEMGLEYGIAAMNSATFAGWTPIAGNKLRATIALPIGKFGDSGVTGTINVEIDNYAAATNARPWDPAANYLSGQVVTYAGEWYRCGAAIMGLSPIASTLWSNVTPVLHAEGIVALPDGSKAIRTQLVGKLTYSTPFPNTLAGTAALTLGPGVTVDSYDSTISGWVPNTGFSAVIAGSNPSTTAVQLQGAVINGYVAAPSSSAAPFNPEWLYDGSVVVKGTVAVPIPKVDLTRVSRSPYLPTFPIPPLTSVGTVLTLAPGGDTAIGTTGDVWPTLYRVAGDLDFSTAATTLTINGPVVIDVVGDIVMTGSDSRIILPMLANGSAEIHFGGVLHGVTGSNGGFDNQTWNPQKLVLLGASNSAAHSFNSSINFYGAIYLPQGTLTWNGGDLYGAISASTFTANTGAFHFDTSLRTSWVPGVEAPYVISKWREVTSPTDPDRVSF